MKGAAKEGSEMVTATEPEHTPLPPTIAGIGSRRLNLSVHTNLWAVELTPQYLRDAV